MNKYVLNNLNIKIGSEVVIDCKYNPERLFEFMPIENTNIFETDFKNKTYKIIDQSHDEYGDSLRLNININYLHLMFRHNVSLIDVPKPVINPIIGQKYIIGKYIKDMRLLLNESNLNRIDHDDYSTFKDFPNHEHLYNLVFNIVDNIKYYNNIYYMIESIDKKYKFIVPSWILYDASPSYQPKSKIIRTFENFKNYYE